MLMKEIIASLIPENPSQPIERRFGLNPRIEAVRRADWPIKVFYALMRQIRESGRTDIIDIGSSVAVHSDDQLKLGQLIASAHQESLAFGHYTEYPSSWGSLTLRRSAANLFHR